MALAACASPAPAWAVRVHVVWEGLPEAIRYEFQSASDAKFTQAVRKQGAASPTTVVELPEAPKFMRIRPVFPEGRFDDTVGEWRVLRPSKWGKTKLPKVIPVPVDANGRMELSWPAPESAGAREILYRVRIQSAKGEVVLDSLVRIPRVAAPRLAGGDYDLRVEAVGDAAVGTFHPEAPEESAHAILEVEELKYDAEAEKARREERERAKRAEKSRDLLELSDPMASGISVDSRLEVRGLLEQEALVETLRLTTRGGKQLGLRLPFVLLERGDRTLLTGGSNPRLGGNPYPRIWVALRSPQASSRNVFGMGIAVDSGIDSSNRSLAAPTGLYLVNFGRFTFGDVTTEFSYEMGSTFPKETSGVFGGTTWKYAVRHFWSHDIHFNPGIMIPPEWIGLEGLRGGCDLGFTHIDPIVIRTEAWEQEVYPNSNRLRFRPNALYRVNDFVFAHLGLELMIGSATMESRLRLMGGATFVF